MEKAPLLEFEDNSNVGPDEPLQQQQPTNPEDLGPPPCYSEPIQGYSLQAITGYPQHHRTAYPSQSTNNSFLESGEGYAPPPAYYPLTQGQGHEQEPGPSHVNNNSTTVVATQPTLATAAVLPPLEDYMVLSIFACMCCWWTIGAYAFMKSSEARNLYMEGDYRGAVSSARMARRLSISAFIIGFCLGFIVVISRVL